MNYRSAIEQTWRHAAPGQSLRDRMELIRYATLAASSHNTQPWKFELLPDRIRILPDFSRRCTAVDPDDHHLYASLGCAAENLRLAAQAAGLSGVAVHDPQSSGVDVVLQESAPAGSLLFDAIPKRQCTRTEYDGKPISTAQLKLLEEAGRGEGVGMLLMTGGQQKAEVAEYVAQGNTAQFADPRWAAELKAWIRFNGREAVRTGDGLFGPVMGNPAVPRWLGELFMKLAFSSGSQNSKDTLHIRSSSAIAVIVSEASDPRHWIQAGRCYESVALQAAALGLRTAFINQPVEVVPLRAQFASFLGIGSKRPDLVIRIGHGPEMPRSLRRPVAAVLKQ